MSDTRHLIGLLLGAEEDWPRAFEAIVERLGAFSYGNQSHSLDPALTDLLRKCWGTTG